MENIQIEKEWVGIEEVAIYLDVKVVTIRTRIKNNKSFPCHKVGKQWKFKIAEIEEWINSGKSAI